MAEYHVENFGCRASQADGAAIAAGLEERGLRPAEGFRTAGVVVLNTCSVTGEADREARSYLRKVRRENPTVRVVVTGCYAQRAPEEIAALPGVDCVIGNSHKARAAEIAAGLAEPGLASSGLAESGLAEPGLASVENFVPLSRLLVDDSFAHAEMALLTGAGGQTRPNLKVQDGCGNRCSFCVIPQTRGGSRSVPLGKVLAAVEDFVAGGGQELVLSGINLGRWGRDQNAQDGAEPRRFEELVEAILRETPLPRLRISSVEPMDWSDRLLALYREFAAGPAYRLARHAHLPLQSGADSILRAMYRRYRPWHYSAKVRAIREALPGAAIGADVMVGFPGETDALFEETYRFIEEHPFTYLHLFPFSARPSTVAWTLHREKPVRMEVVQERMGRLRALIAAKNRRFREGFLGRELSVVTLQQPRAHEQTQAMSDNFLTVEIEGELPANRLLDVRILQTTIRGLHGTAHEARRALG